MHNGYIIFFTTSCAFFSEEKLKEKNISVKLVPTPREFSSDCGISIYFENSDLREIEKILNENNIEFEIKTA